MSSNSISSSMDEVITKIPSVTPQQVVDDLTTISKSTSSKNNYVFYSIIFVIFLLLGFNLFNYLGKGADSLKNIFAPLISFFGYSTTETAKKTIEKSKQGTKLATDLIADSLQDAINVTEDTLNIKNQPSLKRDVNKGKSTTLVPKPDTSDSLTQATKSRKSGYCYVGEDRGFRSCVKVNKNDVCMSGDIFPSHQICVNPSLRE